MPSSNEDEDKHHGVDGRPALIIVESQTFARTCFFKLLGREFPDWDVIEMVSVDALSLASRRKVRLIVFDIKDRRLMDLTVERDLATLRSSYPDSRITVLSDRSDDTCISDVLQRGISGFFPTTTPVEVALVGLRLVLAGGTYFPGPGNSESNPQFNNASLSPEALARNPLQHAINVPLNGRTDLATRDLTSREADVLAKLELGHPNKIIAAELTLSENTVKMHIRNIMRKLRARNRTEAVLLWSRSAGSMTLTKPDNLIIY